MLISISFLAPKISDKHLSLTSPDERPQKVQAIKTEKGSQAHDWLQLLLNPIDNGACQSHLATECLAFHDL